MHQSYRSRIYSLLPENHGVITLAMAASVGVPAVELRKLTARGALERMGRGLYRIPFAPVNKFEEVIAVLDSVAPNAFLVGSSVLSLFDIGLEMPMKYFVFAPDRVRRKIPNSVRFTNRPVPNRFDLIEQVRCQPIYDIIQDRISTARLDRIEREIEDALQGSFISSAERDDLMLQLERAISARE